MNSKAENDQESLASMEYEAMMTGEIAWCRLNQLIKGNVLDGQKEAVHSLMSSVSLRNYLNHRLNAHYAQRTTHA